MVVAALVIEHGGTEDQAIAALLHDAVEDQGGVERLSEIRKKFGDNIAAIVSDCTDAWTEPKPEWRPRKEAYLAVLPGKPRESLLVSLADKTHNAEASPMSACSAWRRSRAPVRPPVRPRSRGASSLFLFQKVPCFVLPSKYRSIFEAVQPKIPGQVAKKPRNLADFALIKRSSS